MTTKWSKDILINRFRLEQRWVEQFGISEVGQTVSETAYQNRFRILNRFLWHLTTLKSEKEQLYVSSRLSGALFRQSFTRIPIVFLMPLMNCLLQDGAFMSNDSSSILL